MTGTPNLAGGWQTLLADLSMILFMLCVSAISTAPPQPQRPSSETAAPQPLAIYRADPDAPPLAEWLRQQPADPRQRLTIVATYAGEGRAAASAEAETLASAAELAGFQPRVTIEPGATGPATVGLAFEGLAIPDRQTAPSW